MTTDANLTGSERVRKLQTVLHAKAKEEPERRFHALIDKVWREDFLMDAWRQVRRNGGTAGVVSGCVKARINGEQWSPLPAVCGAGDDSERWVGV